MKKVGLVTLSLMLIALVTGSALAEIPAGFDLSGSIEAPYNYRSKEINTFLNGQLTTSDFILSPLITVNTKWDLKGKVSGFVCFQNRRLDNSTELAWVDTNGDGVPDAEVLTGGGTADNVDFGAGVNITPEITQAYIKVEEFISPKLTMTYGIQDLNLTLRKGEGAFFMHPAVSTDMPLDMAVIQRFNGMADGIRKFAVEYSGFVFDFGSVKDDNYAACIFWGKTSEEVVEVGTKRDEDLLVGVNVAYKLAGDNNIAKILVAKMMNPGKNMDIMTIGVGADYFGAMPNLEIYGEAYMQSGTLNNEGDSNASKIINTPCDVDQSAMAYRVGGKYDFANNPLKPWAGLSYWFLDGGNDSKDYKGDGTATAPTDKYTENNHFVSLEDSQSTLILEDSLWGLNLNSNYTAIKLEAGITTSLTLGGEKTDLDLKLLYGMFTMNEVPWVRNPGVDGYLYTGDDVAQKTKDALGSEIDLVATLYYTENLNFTLGLGMLSGADFFGSITVDDTNNSATRKDTEAFDSMTLVTFGANLKF